MLNVHTACLAAICSHGFHTAARLALAVLALKLTASPATVGVIMMAYALLPALLSPRIGRVAGGTGEERGVPVFLRATRSFGPATQLNLYAGAVTGGELRVEDASGQLVRKVDFGSAPLLAATFSARF